MLLKKRVSPMELRYQQITIDSKSVYQDLSITLLSLDQGTLLSKKINVSTSPTSIYETRYISIIPSIILLKSIFKSISFPE